MYGKLEAKHNRKMGHVTLFSDVPDEVEEFGEGLIFEMTEEFDELLDDEITTITLTYTDDLIVPEIADREGIHILDRTGNQLVLEYSCSVKEVKDYLSSYGLPRHPEREFHLNFLYMKTQKMIIFNAKWRLVYDSNYCQRIVKQEEPDNY